MIKINNLGSFDSISAIWLKYPEGGKEGDYLTVGGAEYGWDKYECQWRLSSSIIESTARTTRSVYGDLDVHHDVRVGGTLYAKHVKQPNCGLFPTLEKLKEAYPYPEVGMWACVGDTIPAPIYRCDTDGVWTPTGVSGGTDGIELEAYLKKDEVVQSTGGATDKVMSQKAVTDALRNIDISTLLADTPELERTVDVSSMPSLSTWIDGNDLWNDANPTFTSCVLVALGGVSRVKIEGNTSTQGHGCQYCLLKDDDTTAGNTPKYSRATPRLVRGLLSGNVVEIEVPDDAKYLYLCKMNGYGPSSTVLPSSVVFTLPAKNGIASRLDACEAAVCLSVDLTKKKIALMGDSITWLSLSSTPKRGWVTYFFEHLKFGEHRNYARSGATWSNTQATVANVEENTTSTTNDNTLYNQINRLIADVDGGFVPDYLVISAGINDVWFPSLRPDALAKTPDEVMRSEQHYTATSAALCTSIAEAIRLAAEMLWNKLPDVQVILMSPMQSVPVNYDKLRQVTEIERGCAAYLGWDFIAQMDEIPVNRIFEKWGYRMTYDGTHTSEMGARVAGGLIAAKVKSLLRP